MITDILTGLTTALESSWLIALGAAFAWGLLSILLSPCHLSSIPLIIGYISRQEEGQTGRSFALSASFAAGLLLTIILVGVLTAALGRMLGDVGTIGEIIVALILILIGLYLMGFINLPGMGFNPGKSGGKGLLSAAILGFLFGLAVGPCTYAFMAPLLAVVFTSAGKSLLQSVILLGGFGIGHVSLIILAGGATRWVQIYLDWNNDSNIIRYLRILCGLLVICGGLYLLTNTLKGLLL